MLTAPEVDSINTFDLPATVQPRPVDLRASQGKLLLTLPSESVTVVKIDE